MNEIEIDLNKSIEENASDYFERAKKLKRKIDGAKLAVENFRKKLKTFEESIEKEKAKKKESIERKEEVKKRWYDKYHWFVSSEGFLVIGGRDATTNEIIIKKHTSEKDIVLHTDMKGSPFCVIKVDNEEKKPTIKTLQEAADFTVSFSKAWKQGINSLEVFYVKPEQVTKEPRAGEYLTKGAFVIKGKVNYLNGKLNLSIGMLPDKRLMIGPYEAVSKNCSSEIIRIFPGKEKSSKIAKQIQKKFNYNDLDEIIRLLPAGGISLK
ncbi:MAG: hypothetical protein PWR30_19 [Candidatus Woesearchaeota archaeon]|nr:hypothetical protein [Candidatus Woesearchaeota archaeon]